MLYFIVVPQDLKEKVEYFCTCHMAEMNQPKIAPAHSKLTILHQICNYIPLFLVP